LLYGELFELLTLANVRRVMVFQA